MSYIHLWSFAFDCYLSHTPLPTSHRTQNVYRGTAWQFINIKFCKKCWILANLKTLFQLQRLDLRCKPSNAAERKLQLSNG